MANTRHLASPAGLVQIIHLVFGIIVIGCGAASYESDLFKERFFFWNVVAFLIVSVILLVVHIITGNVAVRSISSVTHILGGILLLTGGTLMILSVKAIDNQCSPNPWDADCDGEKPTKLAAASIAIINGILYLAESALILMFKEEEDVNIRGYNPPAERKPMRPNPE